MNTPLNLTLAVIAGFVVGSIVNISILNAGPYVIALPEGADISTTEGLKESMKLFTPANFVPVFLAHALGALVGALVAAKLAAKHRMRCALGIGAFFMLGGITMAILVGGPLWFLALDLVLAYLPMAYLGGKLAGAGRAQAA